MKVNVALMAHKLIADGNLRGVAERRTGRSTALALYYISRAIENPGTEIVVRDHHDSYAADVCLRNRVREMIHKLNLQGFTCSQTSIRCDFATIID